MSRITFSEKSLTEIKYILQEQFAKTYGKPIEYKNLLQRAHSLFKIMKDYSLDSNHIEDLTTFAYTLRDNLKHSKYELIFENGTNLNSVKIKRNNKYEEVKHYASLINCIQNYPEGLLITDEFLKYTFKEVKTIIQKAIKEKRLKIVYQEGSKQQYFFLFPRTYETQYNIRDNTFKYFSMNEYLDLCRDLNSKEDNDQKSKEKKNNNMKEITGDLNYKLPGYMELKEKWIKNQSKK